MRSIFGVFTVISIVAGIQCFAQNAVSPPLTHDTVHVKWRHRHVVIDSGAVVQQHIADSLAMTFLKMPDPKRRDLLVDSILKAYAFKPYLFKYKAAKKLLIGTGKMRALRDEWVIYVIIALLLYVTVLNIVLRKDIYRLLLAFYSRGSLVRLNKDDNLLNSWAFVLLFMLFGLTVGLFIYKAIGWYGVQFSINGFELFISLSGIVVILFVLKILSIRILGFIFDIQRMLNEYIAILYLTYFNIAFVFLPIVICFSLLSSPYIPYLIGAALLIVAAILAVQYVKTTINVMLNFRFQKIYLFIYLCALEICPILILIKALNI